VAEEAVMRELALLNAEIATIKADRPIDPEAYFADEVEAEDLVFTSPRIEPSGAHKGEVTIEFKVQNKKEVEEEEMKKANKEEEKKGGGGGLGEEAQRQMDVDDLVSMIISSMDPAAGPDKDKEKAKEEDGLSPRSGKDDPTKRRSKKTEKLDKEKEKEKGEKEKGTLRLLKLKNILRESDKPPSTKNKTASDSKDNNSDTPNGTVSMIKSQSLSEVPATNKAEEGEKEKEKKGWSKTTVKTNVKSSQIVSNWFKVPPLRPQNRPATASSSSSSSSSSFSLPLFSSNLLSCCSSLFSSFLSSALVSATDAYQGRHHGHGEFSFTLKSSHSERRCYVAYHSGS